MMMVGNEANGRDPEPESTEASTSLEPAVGGTVLPFEDLLAPVPAGAAPSLGARILAFASILVGGLLGALIGYGTADIMTGSSLWAGAGGLVGAGLGAVGVGIVASLTLRAMNEWHAAQHPEDQRATGPRQGRS